MIKFIYVMISPKACEYIAFEVSAQELQSIFAVFHFSTKVAPQKLNLSFVFWNHFFFRYHMHRRLTLKTSLSDWTVT